MSRSRQWAFLLPGLSDSLRTGHGSKYKREGRMIGSQQAFDVLVIGGGPAGLAAAMRAAECGLHVGIVDDNARLGGQIWRSESGGSQPAEAEHWIGRLVSAGVTPLCGTRIFHQPEPGLLLAEGTNALHELRYGKLVLATGARERFLPFPGWILPNVMGAGGLQAMVKSGLPIRGKRVVVAGTGPLLLAVAAHLRKQRAEISLICEQASWSSLARFSFALLPEQRETEPGKTAPRCLLAEISLICEQASWSSLARFSFALLGQPGKIAQALQLRRELAGIPFSANRSEERRVGK